MLLLHLEVLRTLSRRTIIDVVFCSLRIKRRVITHNRRNLLIRGEVPLKRDGAAAARENHNLKVKGSSPFPATTLNQIFNPKQRTT